MSIFDTFERKHDYGHHELQALSLLWPLYGNGVGIGSVEG